MRYTLEQLQAKSDEELKYMWDNGLFPFDTARCGHCVTQHGTPGKHWDCEHQGFRKAAAPLWEKINGGNELWVRPVLEEIYALRMFYDSIYPQQTVEETHAEVLVAEIERQKERIEENELEWRADLVRGEEE